MAARNIFDRRSAKIAVRNVPVSRLALEISHFSEGGIFDQIQQEMRTQYAIGYTPTNGKKDGSFRKIDLRTANKDLKVQVRKGYYAIPPLQ